VQRDLNSCCGLRLDSILIDEKRERLPLIIIGCGWRDSLSEAVAVKIKHYACSLLVKTCRRVKVKIAYGHLLGWRIATTAIELTGDGHSFVRVGCRAGFTWWRWKFYACRQPSSVLHHVSMACWEKATMLFFKKDNRLRYQGYETHLLLMTPLVEWWLVRVRSEHCEAESKKKGLTIQAESQTLASTTFKNYLTLSHMRSLWCIDRALRRFAAFWIFQTNLRINRWHCYSDWIVRFSVTYYSSYGYLIYMSNRRQFEAIVQVGQWEIQRDRLVLLAPRYWIILSFCRISS